MESQIFAVFPVPDRIGLAKVCLSLQDEQKKSWPKLAQANLALSDVRIRSISVGNYQVVLQFNPQRAASSGAAVDRESIKNRPCFLCTDNLPAEQKGILYKNDYMILCNPAPIFEKHFTVVYKQHLPQAITPSLKQLLELTRDLAPDFALFYNGPACGASAPDHLHFQIIPENSLPILKNTGEQFRNIKNVDGVNFYVGKNLDRTAFILEGENNYSLRQQFIRLLKILQKVTSSTEEPMINVICTFSKPFWRLMIFPRRKHRPDAFYLEGENRIFVSLGAIDMAGIIITPLITDFNRLDAAQIINIYREVSLAEDSKNKVIAEF